MANWSLDDRLKESYTEKNVLGQLNTVEILIIVAIIILLFSGQRAAKLAQKANQIIKELKKELSRISKKAA